MRKYLSCVPLNGTSRVTFNGTTRTPRRSYSQEFDIENPPTGAGSGIQHLLSLAMRQRSGEP